MMQTTPDIGEHWDALATDGFAPALPTWGALHAEQSARMARQREQAGRLRAQEALRQRVNAAIAAYRSTR